MERLLISNFFYPFPGGEQFLETEIEHWSQYSGIDEVILAPESFASKSEQVKEVNGLKVLCIPVPSGVFLKLKSLAMVLFSSFFWVEVLNILRYEKKTKILYLLREALFSCVNVLRHKKRLEILIKNTGELTGIYCYWSEFAFYAASLLKREGKVKKVFVRAHGYDLYKERRSYSYMPLKKQFAKDADIAFFLSSQAQSYYLNMYGCDKSTTDIARLGVKLPANEQRYIKSFKQLKLLSLSYCVPVKRLDKILTGVIEFANQFPDIQVIWNHIGNGEGYSELKCMVLEQSSEVRNLSVELKGGLHNRAVHDILESEQFDAIVNASESEGIPVSIMEAMSYGIPAIAPNVGGISDLVNESNGFLLSNKCSIEELVNAFNSLYFDKAPSDRRREAREWVRTYFNAGVNHIEFIQKLSRSINE